MNSPLDRQPPPPNVLSYSGPVVVQEPDVDVVDTFRYETINGVFTITIPPPPLAGQLTNRNVKLALLVLAIGIFLAIPIVATDRGTIVVSLVIASIFAYLAVLMIREMRYLKREKNRPSIIRAWGDGLEIYVHGRVARVHHYLPRTAIADVRIHPAGSFRPVLTLDIVLTDDTVRVVTIPWRRGEPMITVEDNIRDRLGLSVETQE